MVFKNLYKYYMTPKGFIMTLQSISFTFQQKNKEESEDRLLEHIYMIYHSVKKKFPKLDIKVAPSILIAEWSKKIYPQAIVIWINEEEFYDVNYNTWALQGKTYYECPSEIPKKFKELVNNDLTKAFYETVDLCKKINSGCVLKENDYYGRLVDNIITTFKELND
tara:strand:- start:400 stop:894 length:495 start_codon:yes stop_codon:yes gene_type:complete